MCICNPIVILWDCSVSVSWRFSHAVDICTHSRRYPKLFGTKINSFTDWNVLVRHHCEFGSVVFRKLLVICEKAKAITKC